MALFVYETMRWIDIGFMKVPTYAVFANIAFFSAALFIFYMVRKEKRDVNTAIFILLSALAGMLIGAKLFYFFGPWSWQYDWSLTYRLVRSLQVWGSGLVFYGGFFGGALGVYLYAKIRKVNILSYLDIMALSLGIVAAVSRIGCWFAGCCSGTPTTVPWAILRNGVAIHPTQLYFVIAGVAVFIIACLAHKRKMLYGYFDGYTTIVAVFWYALTRFYIEFFRVDPRYLGFTASQWISLLLLIVTGVLYLKLKRYLVSKTVETKISKSKSLNKRAKTSKRK
jgi:phosphatidylglycerol---prolipoprotein diacylglyceryl transferase